MENKSSINRPANTYVVGTGEARAFVQFAALPNEATNDVGRVNIVAIPNTSASAEIMYWGKKNDLPQYREELISGNNIVPSLIQRKRDIICGQGWMAYKERFEETKGKRTRIIDEVPMPSKAEEFFDMFRGIDKELVVELCKHSLAMPEFIRGKGGEIVSIQSNEVKYMRAERREASSGKIRNWYWGNNWDTKRNGGLKMADRKIVKLPVYDKMSQQTKFVLPLMDSMLNDGYYPIPAYWGGRHWINLSNIIPLFHEANLQHGQSPRWHIILPFDFFWDYKRLSEALDAEAEKKLYAEFKLAEQKFVDDLNDVLTGIGNTGRTITSKSEVVELMGGKYEKRIHIEPLKAELHDEALIKLYEASNVANISGQGIHPTLANIETQGKLSSGTEIRNAFLMYLIIAAPAYRDQLAKIIDLVKSENKWTPGIKYMIRDAELTTLAENPSGVRPAETPVAK